MCEDVGDGDGYVIPLSEAAAAFAAENPVPRDRAWEEGLHGVYSRIVIRTSPYARFHMREAYYGRGIRLWEGWADPEEGFERFAQAARGWQKGLQLDRVDNDEGYAPGNLRLSTPSENIRNRRNTLRVTDPQGEEHCLAELAEELGIGYQTFRNRYYRGATWAELTAPPLQPRVYTIEGGAYTMGELYAEAQARGSSLGYGTLKQRLRRGDRAWERLLRPVVH